MKSAIMKRSLAMLLTVLMMLSVCALSFQMVVLAVEAEDNKPCDCGAAVTIDVVKPTCLEWGGTWHTCSECGKKWVTEPTAPSGAHDFSINKSVEATCTATGSVGWFCSVCGAASPDNKTTDALGHDWTETITGGDCETELVVTKTCSRCDATETNKTPATGHNHQAGDLVEVDYKAPTCTEGGFVKFVCTVCGDVVLAKFDQLAHTLNTEKIEPTCDAYGYEKDGICKVCGAVPDAAKQIDKIDHNYETKSATDVVNGEAGYQAPVCSPAGFTNGWQYKVCSVCGNTVKDSLEAAHNPVFKETVEPDCATKKNGYYLYVCQCGVEDKKNEVPYEHKYPTTATVDNVLYTFMGVASDENVVLGTDGHYYYSADGKIPYYTADANETVEGYARVLWVVQIKPAKGETAVLVHSCTVCKDTVYLSFMIDHVNAQFVETVEPTCTEGGYDYYTCECCEDGYTTNPVAALGHLDKDGVRHASCSDPDCIEMGIYVPAVDPDCATNTAGVSAYRYCMDPTCEFYGKNGTTVEATHNYTAKDVTILASCAYPAFVVKGCTCGAVSYDLNTADGMRAAWNAKTSIVAGSTYLGHDWNSESIYVVVEKAKVEATCSTPGNEEFKKCQLCGDTDSLTVDVIPVLASKFVVKKVVPATCRTKGYTLYTCDNVDWKHGETCDVHEDYKVYDEDFNPTNNGHKILGAVYGEDGRVDLTDATVLTAEQLIEMGVIADESEYHCISGSCSSEVNLFYHGWHICSVCGEPYFFAVKRVHTPGDDATCTEAQNCTECNEELTEAFGHDWETTGTTDATCTVGEKIHQTCSKCGETQTVDGETAALGHNYNIPANTCTEDTVCARCGDTKAKLNHKKTDGTDATVPTTTKATCTADGQTVYTCSLCHKVVKTETIPATGHVWEEETGIADRDANCTKYGYKNILGCVNCDEYHGTDFEDVRGHDYKDQTKVATCEEEGYSAQVCSVCGDTIHEKTTDPTGHWNDLMQELLKDCAYLKTIDPAHRVCVNGCGVDFDPEKNHDWKKPESDATCTEDGVIAQYCKICSTKKVIGTEPALGHNYQLDTTHESYKAATMTQPGIDVFVCQNGCGDSYIEETDALGGVIVSATATNKWDAEAKIVNNGIIAYTIYIEGLNAKFYSLKVDVTFDNTVLTYIGYNLGSDAANIFGNRENNIGTDVGAGKIVDNMTTLGFYGFNQNNTAEEKVDVSLNDKQEFVTVYFRVNGDVRTDSEADQSTVSTAITLGTITCLTAADESVATAGTGSAATVEIYKLGDCTDDAVLASEDLSAIKEHIIAGTYDARADINVDGVVTAEDLILLAQKYVYTFTYEDLFDMAIAYDPALSDLA